MSVRFVAELEAGMNAFPRHSSIEILIHTTCVKYRQKPPRNTIMIEPANQSTAQSHNHSTPARFMTASKSFLNTVSASSIASRHLNSQINPTR